jgi:hypothetical protein
VLFGQHGGGHQHGDLLGFTDRQKGGPQGHFGFSVAHIPADQAVHGGGAAHVLEHIFDGLELVRGLFIGKVRLEVCKMAVGRAVSVPGVDLSLGVDLEQFTGDFFRRLAHLSPWPAPRSARPFCPGPASCPPPPCTSGSGPCGPRAGRGGRHPGRQRAESR